MYIVSHFDIAIDGLLRDWHWLMLYFSLVCHCYRLFVYLFACLPPPPPAPTSIAYYFSRASTILSIEALIWSVCSGCKECRASWANMRWQHTKTQQTFLFYFIFHHFDEKQHSTHTHTPSKFNSIRITNSKEWMSTTITTNNKTRA